MHINIKMTAWMNTIFLFRLGIYTGCYRLCNIFWYRCENHR